ncbi:MAG: hypothetical protein ACPHXR_01770 [Flavicella sp.]
MLLSFLLISSMGFSQFSFDFSATTNDNWIADQGIGSVTTSTASPATNGAIGVVTSSASGQDWQNAQIVLQSGDNKMDLSGTNKTLTFNYYSNEAGGGMIKLEGNGATNVELHFEYSTPNTWVPISLDFTAADGEYEKLIYFPHYGSGLAYDGVNMPKNDTKVSYFDDVSAPLGSVIQDTSAPPTVSAPTPPARAATDVISIYSGAYIDVIGSNFNPNWGQSGHASANASYDPGTGDLVLAYTNFNYQGIQIGATQDISSMEYLHVDIWVAGVFNPRIFVISGGAEIPHTITNTAAGAWISTDIEVTGITGNLNNAYEIKFDGGSGSNPAIYVDNLYFWRTPPSYDLSLTDLTIDGTTIDGFSSAASSYTKPLLSNTTIIPTVAASNSDTNVSMTITQATTLPGQATVLLTAPNNNTATITVDFTLTIPASAAPTPPVRDPSNVISIYSDAYDDIVLTGFPTSWSDGTHTFPSIGGNEVIFGDGSEFIGIQTEANGIDLSSMEYMHIDYFTFDDIEIKMKLVKLLGGATDQLVSLGTTVTGSWQSVDIAMTNFDSVDLTAIEQLLIDPQGRIDVYYDNFYFYREASMGLDDTNSASSGIYPNPTNGPINVSGDVFSVTGQKLLENTDDLSSLPSGIYFVRSQGTTSKVIKN